MSSRGLERQKFRGGMRTATEERTFTKERKLVVQTEERASSTECRGADDILASK